MPENPVLIVGAGPVGAVLALELAHHGVASTVIERSEIPRHPKMDYLNARSMELLRRLGLADELRAMGVPGDQELNFLWTKTFAEPPVAEWHYPSVDEFRRLMAKTNDGSLPCEAYQRVIGSRLEELGRRRCRDNPLIDLREGWSFEGLATDDDGVSAEVVEVSSGRRENIRALYAVACDGANSAVRRSVGIETEEVGPVSQNANIYFRSSDPQLLQHGRFFLAIGAAGLTLVSRDGRDTWTAVFPRFDGKPFEGDPAPALSRLLGIDLRIDELISVANWENRLAIAHSYRKGPVFLAGDSAHQYFPSGGYGANTGIGDAVDLGWKLAAVVNGWAGSRVLDSYEAERRPVAIFNREMCFNLMEVWRRFIMLDKSGASSAQLTGYLDHQAYQTQALGIHFGYRYSTSPIVARDTATPEPAWDTHRIIPTTWPGGRAPSVRLADTGAELFDLLGPGLTLVDLSGSDAGAPLVAAAAGRGIPVTRLRIDDANVRAVWERDLVLVRPDQHVAWRGNEVPTDPTALLALISGQ